MNHLRYYSSKRTNNVAVCHCCGTPKERNGRRTCPQCVEAQCTLSYGTWKRGEGCRACIRAMKAARARWRDG